MALYFFHFQNGPQLVRDVDGVYLASPADALERATRLAEGLLGEREIECDLLRSAIRVEDQHHRRVLCLPMTCAMARENRQRARAH
ncbi:DUF6894 family protein [Methylobacterium nodulans]|uniref:DUF6894 domain-containing protein n=1 Tax=Methylobacterium nodulans (strain LMG 21967 / CNCM I-2342 / ORS 2060) TaxID=460265 RepID=B8IQU6_METNO|nr:hypothetical protein [Methylobacterium nodulans]ACL62391.1 conserved hypothetical protein [Methylobacterium nodulans ORS 2060]